MICKPGNIPHSQPLIKEHSSGPFKIERICGDGQLQYQRTGRWSQLENRKYIEFLKQN